jgi:CHAD domain-containing protein
LTAPSVTLELALAPEAAARLHRLPPLAPLTAGRPRKSVLDIVWYDTPTGALAADGLALCERKAGREPMWRLERIRSTPNAPWAPGTPPPLVAEAPSLAEIGNDLPAPLLPVAAFSGTLRTRPLDADAALTVSILDGVLRAVAGERPVCRVLLTGPTAALEPLTLALAETSPLSVPAVALAAEAYTVAGRAPPPPALGAPELPADVTVGDAFARVVAHLTFAMLHCAPLAGLGATPEPVHQMRVALRRLRSAVKLFHAAVGGAEIDAVNAELGALSRVLGPARDWDVFCAGTGATIAGNFPQDRAVARLLKAADRQRRQSYAALATHLGSPAFRLLGVRLACLAALRPWELSREDAAAAKLAAALPEFAGRALSRRLARLRPPEGDFADLPVADLHALRIQAKRLRYAGEFFASLFPRKETRRFLRRVGDLQERLGHLNDGAVAEALMAQLGHNGAERAMAVGIVRGFAAAGARDARASSERSWRKLRRLEPFWK